MANIKTVALPIRVPIGNYCWDGQLECQYLDKNFWGKDQPACHLEFNVQFDDANRIPKDERCLRLPVTVDTVNE